MCCWSSYPKPMDPSCSILWVLGAMTLNLLISTKLRHAKGIKGGLKLQFVCKTPCWRPLINHHHDKPRNKISTPGIAEPQPTEQWESSQNLQMRKAVMVTCQKEHARGWKPWWFMQPNSTKKNCHRRMLSKPSMIYRGINANQRIGVP